MCGTSSPARKRLVRNRLESRDTISLRGLRINRHLHLYEVLTRWRDCRVRHREVLQPATGVKITYHEKITRISLHTKIKKRRATRWPVQGIVAE